MLFHFKQSKVEKLPNLNLIIEGTPIDRVSNFNFLGITIQEHLDWNCHINKITTKLNRSIGVIRRLQDYLPIMTLKTLYNALILPHLQYGILLWGNSSQNLKILQKRAIRVVCKAKYRDHTEPLFKILESLNLSDMFEHCCLKFVHKHRTGKLPAYFDPWFQTPEITHNHNTRRNTGPPLPEPLHPSLRNSLKFLVSRLLQTKHHLITDKLESHSLYGFSQYVKKWLLSAYSESCTKPNCFVCSSTT